VCEATRQVTIRPDQRGCATVAEARELVSAGLAPLAAHALRRHAEGCAACDVLIEQAQTQHDLQSSQARIGRYVVLEELGRGGMGQVFAAWDPQLNRRIALKVLLPGLQDERLLTEAQALARLSHPNVVQVFDAGLHQGQVYIAMEFVEGPSLRAWLKSAPRTRREILERFKEAAKGLFAAHEAGLVHRDFKPANAVCAPSGVKVLDFGLALAISEPLAAGLPPSLSQTSSGRVSGTPAYMPPEQRRGEVVDARADIFSFCASLYEALGGTKWPQAVAREVPAWLLGVLRRGLADSPLERWSSIRELLAALDADPARTRKRVLLGLGAALLLVAVPLGQQVYTQHRLGRCSGKPERDTFWSEGRRADVRARAKGVAGPTVVAATERIDTYAEAWRGQYQRLCEATNVRHEQPEYAFLLQRSCLFRAGHYLDELVSSAHVETQLGSEALATSLDSLRDLSGCDDAAALAQLAEGEPATKAEAIKSIRDRLDHALAISQVDTRAHARELAEPLVDEVVALGVPSVEAEVLTVVGQFAKLDARWGLQVRAYQAALASGNLPTAARASIELVGLVPGDSSALRSFIEGLARSTCERAGWTLHRRALLAERVGDAAYERGDYVLAEQQAVEMIRLLEAASDTQSRSYAAALSNQANALYMLGKPKEGAGQARRAFEVMARLFGADSILTLSERGNLGMQLVEAGRIDEALVELEDTLRRLEETVGRDASELGGTLDALGSAYEALERFAEARTIRQRFLELRIREDGPDAGGTMLARANLATVLLALGETRAAERELRRSLADFAGPQGLHPDAVDPLITLSMLEASCQPLETATPMLQAAPGTPFLRARFAFARARCEKATPAQARWAREAHSLALEGGRALFARRIEQWVETRPAIDRSW
jgi:eukaryotic-like serine/threonine-protein kinase